MFRIPKTMPVNTVVTKRPKQTQTCLYSSYECTQPCLEGYNYCSKHILEDPNAPYKQCGFVYNTNGRKCQNPAPKFDRRDISYCSEHTRKAQIARIKSTARHSLPQTPEMLLLNLSHYVKRTDSSTEDTEDEEGKVKALDPFTEVDAYRVNASGCDILDYASSSDSDVEPTVVSDTLRGSYLDDSDNESLYSAQEDPLNINFLRHAGVFTAEEVIYIAREKLIRLQSLYIDQFRRLQYILKEKRRKYLHALKKEKETLCSIHDQPKETVKEKKVYEKLKALNRYHRRSGVEAILYRKSLERRAQATDGSAQKVPSISKCIFTEGGVKCGERTLPAAKHCRKHILKDQHQVLFKACGAVRADIECHEPVPVIFDTNCVFHMNLPSECKLESMKFKESKPEMQKISAPDNQSMEIDVVGEIQDIDPDDDMAGLMREMSDAAHMKPVFNESLNSEASTDTAFSLSAQMSDRDDLVSM
ncbi:KAT8 regulatory NSL complex subunit dim gamma-tubulin 1 isoform X1 [Megachile rotundata]|uniref:KAT8 regulatory NSL complex subunit dim gamma-tubulin 1 isoform X1 n=2 Tax=Megachile rotundata TaxID=143995 RepID=UPI00061531D3|nr:PREDICTED: KAT8 regulatory NSL complex subunit 2 isoform X1 [Megachile rotundata]XP_012139846.1 PREDICTED: KAT8 regulatory NSL complex subunit 2 isoform X1 [Megachile rotundata]XP_012139847.1 PREDICTED: KAT8 regulatory NSL complex subunit 2 isoform X1 [Megachile rotundata]XP_012139848.1 PREDICTED: KAT8 regulatory NSL complex subunit 2 isoform X1 [Megachile rotundata]